MGNQKKSGCLKGLFRASRSASSDSNLARDPAGGPYTGQSDADSQSGQSSAGLSPPVIGRGRRLINRLRWRSRSSSPLPSPSPEVEPLDMTTDHRITAPTSSSGDHGAPSIPVVQGSSYASVSATTGATTSVPTIRVSSEPTASEGSAPTSAPTAMPTIQILPEPTASKGSASPSPGTPHISPVKSDAHTAADAASASPSGDHGSPSVPVVQGSSYTPVSSPTGAPTSVPTIQVLSEPTASVGSAPPSPGTPHISPAKIDAHAAADPGPIEPPSQSSVVWTKAIDIAKKKLIENNLPPLDLTNLSTQSEEHNIDAVINSLNTLQEDEQKKRWSYTWRGKEIIIVERLGKILRSVEKYSKIVGSIVQSDPKVAGLVWASIQGIIQVRI